MESKNPRLVDLMTVDQTAADVGLSVEGIYKAIKRGELRAHKVGRMLLIERSEVASYKAARERIVGRRAEQLRRERID